MRWSVVAIGQRMPAWVDLGWAEYARRFSRSVRLELREIPAIKRARNAEIDVIRTREGGALLAAIPASDRVIALDVDGRQYATTELAEQMREWLQTGRDLSFLVGGPEGLATACLERAEWRWSLGRLTFPHPLVRVILAEQLYRAWTITHNHPYHRQ